MKLSQFKGFGAKKIKFVNGDVVIEQNAMLNGEIDFYNLDVDRLRLMQAEVLSKASLFSDNEVMYKLLPYLCDLDVDITFEEFEEMVNHPSKEFTVLFNQLVGVLTSFIQTVDTLQDINDKVDYVSSKFNFEKESLPTETKEEKLERLYNELSASTDKAKRKELFREISSIENES